MKLLAFGLVLLGCLKSLAAPDIQVIALHEMRMMLTDSRGVLKDWNDNQVSPCYFDNVRCDQDGKVIGITLSSSGLSGILSPSIATLTTLQQLLLDGNSITGGIPQELGNLSNLMTLKLGRNSLNGSIPESFGLLSELENLDLSENLLIGNIPNSLSNLSSLNNINLAYNSLSGEIPEQLLQVSQYNYTGNHLNCGPHLISCNGSTNKTGGSSNTTVKVILGSIGGAVVLIVSVVLFLLWWQRMRHRPDIYIDVAGQHDHNLEFGQIKRFSWRELQTATNNFSEQNVLGKGGFGTGRLHQTRGHRHPSLMASSSAAAATCRFLTPLATTSRTLLSYIPPTAAATSRRLLLSSTTAICAAAMAASGKAASASCKVVDSHLHVWASPLQAAENYPFFPGQETTLRGDVDFLLQCMDEAGVDGALIVQPINHMFDHSLVTSVLQKYPSKFIGCCLANPADDGSGIKQLEHLIVQEKYRAVRFNPNLWPSGQKMTNEVGRSLFAKAGELGAPVGIMVMKGISSYIQEIEELCTDYPATTVIFDHMAFCKPPTNDEEEKAFSSFLSLARFPQVYVKYSALFRITREAYPYEDTSQLLSRVISSYGANRIMWGSDFPYVVPECGYKGAKEAISHVAGKVAVSSSDLEWILGKTVSQLFQGAWVTP